MALVYFVTHPEVEIDPTVPVPEWHLNSLERKRVKKMLKQPWVRSVTHVYSSRENKAVETAEIMADFLGTYNHEFAELGEIDRSSTGYLIPGQFERARVAFFSRPSESYQGWESAESARERIVSAVQIIVEKNGGNDVAICSHGAVGTLLLCALEGAEIKPEKDQLRAGCYFVFEAEGMKLLHGWKLIDEIEDAR